MKFKPCSTCGTRNARFFQRKTTCPECVENRAKAIKKAKTMARLIATPGYVESLEDKASLVVNRKPVNQKEVSWHSHEHRRLSALGKAPPSAMALRFGAQF